MTFLNEPVAALLAIASSAHGPEGHLPVTAANAGAAAHDHLSTPAAALAWLAPRRELVAPREPPSRRDLDRLRLVRDAAQAFARGRAQRYARDVEELLHGATFGLSPDGLAVPLRRGWAGLVDELLIPLVALPAAGDRIKFCANERCHWIFMDRSTNRRARWCDPAACGNRMRVRAYRRRAVTPPGRGARRTGAPEPRGRARAGGTPAIGRSR